MQIPICQTHLAKSNEGKVVAIGESGLCELRRVVRPKTINCYIGNPTDPKIRPDSRPDIFILFLMKKRRRTKKVIKSNDLKKHSLLDLSRASRAQAQGPQDPGGPESKRKRKEKRKKK